MLKKMRWRFITAAMAAIVTVVATLLCVVNVWNYRIVAQQQDDTLKRLAEIDFDDNMDTQLPLFDEMDRFSPEVPYMIRFFAVHFNKAGEIQQTNQQYIASITQEQAVEYAAAALETGKSAGYYQGYRYLIAEASDGITVVFLNSERELLATRNLLVVTLAIALCCLVVVFILVVLFSRRAIAPYVRNLETQKQFITNASHELKTPLTAIATSADVLAMEHEDDEWVQSIQTQAAKLSKLITNLVTLSRVNEENPFPTRTEFSLSDALWETTEPFVALAKARNKEYSQQIEDNLTVTGDRMAIQQTVSILLDNAIKYTPDGGKIQLRVRQSGKRVELEVSNTCQEGAKIDVSRLFDRFYRADESHSGSIGGTGIGLSIAKATIDAHGGTIHAEQKNGWITFRIRL